MSIGPPPNLFPFDDNGADLQMEPPVDDMWVWIRRALLVGALLGGVLGYAIAVAVLA